MENWKPIPNYEGIYEVSDAGQVKRIAGGSNNAKPGRILRPGPRAGYLYVQLCRHGHVNHQAIHRLVIEAFVGPISEGLQVNHKNGVRGDNRLENLEIMTASQNHLHSFRELGRKPSGGRLPGSTNPNAKLTEEKVREIRRLWDEKPAWGYQQELARQFEVDDVTINHVIRRYSWKHV